jgi:hypothetical protein
VDEPLVEVEVMVNVDSMRRGQVGRVELTPRIQSLADRGYLKIRGHVATPAIEVFSAPPEAPETHAPVEAPARRSRPSRAKREATTTPPEASSGDSAGDTHLE